MQPVHVQVRHTTLNTYPGRNPGRKGVKDSRDYG
nr:MAG TPA: Photosystem II protein D1 [Caudoviricetes sp.]